MSVEKLKEILASMSGITFLEWKKLSQTIEDYFESEATIQNNQIVMADPERIIDSYRRLF